MKNNTLKTKTDCITVQTWPITMVTETIKKNMTLKTNFVNIDAWNRDLNITAAKSTSKNCT